MTNVQDLVDSLDEQNSQQQQNQDKTAQIQVVKESGQQIVGELQSLKDVLLASPIAKDKKVAQVATKLAGLITQLDEATSAIRGANFKPLADNLAQLDKTVQGLPSAVESAHLAVDTRPHLEELNSTLKKKNFQPIINVPQIDLSAFSSLLTDIKDVLSKDSDSPVDTSKLEKLTGEVSTAVSGVKSAVQALRFPVPNYVLPFKTIDGKATQAQLDSTGKLAVSASFGGSLSNNNAAPGATNLGVLPAVANVAAPSYGEGNQVLLSTDLAGALRVTGSLSVGGTTDNSAYTAGSSTGTPALGFYHSAIDSVTDGRAAAVAITAKRAQMVNLQTSAGAETGVAASPLQVSLANTAANTNKLLVTPDSVALPANQSVNVSQINGVTPLMGNGVTGTGSQRVTIASDNTAFAVNATLQTGSNTIGALTANQSINNAQIAGVATATGNGVVGTGVQRVAIASDNTAFAVNATLSAETTKVIGVTRTADGAGNLLTSTGSALDVNLKTSAAANISTNLAQVNGATTLAGNGVSGTGAQRVTIASDSTGQMAPAANATATGTSIYNNNALSSTKQAANASGGNLYGYHIYNPNSVVIYIQLWNVASASVTVGTTAPTAVIAVPPGGWADSAYPVPINFGTALTIAATTTATGLTAPTTALLCNLWYK